MKKVHHWGGGSLNNNNCKIALGTVQFGLNYGINNKSGVIDDKSLTDLLNYAFEKGVDTLDTAYNYGNSEERIGKYLSGLNKDFKIVSKAPKGSDSKNIKKYFQESLDKLNSNSLYGYILHDFEDYLNDKEIINALKDLKQKRFINKIGFSIYHPEHLDILFHDKINFELIQFPYNLADRRFEKYFEQLKSKNVEIHIRSVFLQGLFFMTSDELPEKLKPFSKFLDIFNELSKKLNRKIENIAINFVAQNQNVDKIVIGIDNQVQLKSNLEEINNKIDLETLIYIQNELNRIYIPQELLIPSNWN